MFLQQNLKECLRLQDNNIKTGKKRLFDGVSPGLGMYSQYYVYGKKFMIDEETGGKK